MQTQADGSHSILTDGNSFHTPLLLSSLPYTSSLDRQIQNHITTTGEPLVNFTCGQMSYPQLGSIIQNMEIENVVPSNTSLVNSAYGSPNCNYEALPLDASMRWAPPNGNSVLNEWIMTQNGELGSNYPCSSQFGNRLSLSLATYQPSMGHRASIHEQCSEMSSSSSNNNLSVRLNSYKPLQLSSLLSGSRFFHAMQEILAEIASYALENFDHGANASMSSSCNSVVGFANEGDRGFAFQNDLLQEREVEAKKKHLLSLLQLVDEQYSQCLDEIHTVISAFHAVTELDPNLHARFALPKVSLMYKNLRDRISSHILAMGAHFNEGEVREDNSFETSFIHKQWAIQQLRKREHQLWRPQRGLPERSVSVLRAWMFQNFLHPYPKDAEKHLLALKSGLTRSQVSNWFINARVRLWKPMIEEMYAEMNRRKARRNDEEMVDGGANRNYMRCDNRIFTMD